MKRSLFLGYWEFAFLWLPCFPDFSCSFSLGMMSLYLRKESLLPNGIGPSSAGAWERTSWLGCAQVFVHQALLPAKSSHKPWYMSFWSNLISRTLKSPNTKVNWAKTIPDNLTIWLQVKHFKWYIIWFIFILPPLCVVCVCAHTHRSMLWHMCGGQRTKCSIEYLCCELVVYLSASLNHKPIQIRDHYYFSLSPEHSSQFSRWWVNVKLMNKQRTGESWKIEVFISRNVVTVMIHCAQT